MGDRAATHRVARVAVERVVSRTRTITFSRERRVSTRTWASRISAHRAGLARACVSRLMKKHGL